FEELLAQGEALFGAKDYQGAKAKYEEAKVLDKASPIPTEKIKQIDEILAQMANEEKLKADIESWMTKADASFAATKFEEAIASYQKVLELDKDNSKATAQIEASKQALEDAKNQEALAQRKAAYDAAIAKGDELKGATKLDE